jgi:uncharacterized membrane protein
MNDAHLHMVVNHFPIIGTILGLGILICSFLFKNTSYRNVAYGLFIVSAIFAAVSMATGEGAEEMVEEMPEIGKKIIHDHEEWAEKLALFLYLLGLVSIVGLYLDFKKHSKGKLFAFVALVISLISVFFAIQTGTSGGEIRHTEIRADYKSPEAANTSTDNLSKED